MSLQVWLPLNGNIINYGSSTLTFTNTDSSITYFSNNTGKIVDHSCYRNALSGGAIVSNGKLTLGSLQSMFCWVKFTTLCSSSALSAIGGQHRYQTCTGMGITLKYVSATTGYLSVNTGDGNGSRTYNTYCGKTLLSANKWYHLGYTYDGETIKLYVNGKLDGEHAYTVQAAPITDYIGINMWSFANKTVDNVPYSGYQTIGYLNDFRIYDDCLGPKAVQDLSQGLMLHYKLDDMNIEATTNLAPYPTPGDKLGAIGWNQSLHPNAISVSSWGSGYNGGVPSPASGYHAHWEIVDTLPTMVFPDLNSHYGLGHRWLGITTGGFEKKLQAGKPYTISFDAKSTVDGMKVSAGCHFYVTGNATKNFHDGCPTFILSQQWKRYSYTFTCNANIDTSQDATFFFYGHNSSVSGTSYMRNVQIELKDHPTGYTRTSRTSCELNDVSGCGHNGEIVGSVSTNKNSARYSNCMYITDGRSNYGKSQTMKMPGDAVTMSCWFKSSTTGYSSYHIPISFNSGAYEFSVDSSGHFRNGFNINGGRQVLTTSHTSILDGKWHMITATYDGSTIRRYVDGKELTSYATSIAGTLDGNTGNLLLGNYNGTTYGNSNTYMSDVRIYATALTAADVLDLYQASIKLFSSDAKDNTLEAYEFIENAQDRIQIQKNGIIHIGGVDTTRGPTLNMPFKVLASDGSIWLRVHYLNVLDTKTWFTTNEVQKCINQDNRYSYMHIFDYLSNSTYEFMLTYPSLSTTLYNRWKQTSSPNASTVTGYEPIEIAWSLHSAGIRKHGSSCVYNCDSGSTWFAPIGQLGPWDSSTNRYIPAADGTSQTSTELWLKVGNCDYNSLGTGSILNAMSIPWWLISVVSNGDFRIYDNKFLSVETIKER